MSDNIIDAEMEYWNDGFDARIDPVIPAWMHHDAINRKESTMSARERILAQINAFERRLAKLDRFGDDDFDDGTVFTFDKKYGNKSYTYAAVKATGRWWLTGRTSEGLDWESFVEFLDGADVVYIATEVEELTR